MALEPVTTSSENQRVSPGWEPEGPFLRDVPLPHGGAAPPPAMGPFAPTALYETASPFVPDVPADGGARRLQAELFASLMADLHDQEFAEALEDLVDDVAAVADEGFSYECGDPARQRFEMERAMGDYLDPLRRSAESLLDRMAEGLGDKDLTALPEPELEALLDQFAPSESGLSPAFENALGGFFRKAKRAIKGAVKIARKAAGALSKVLPMNVILGKLKALVRPLLERVLRSAIDRLPVALRPVAGQLAKRFLGISVDTSPAGEPSTGDQPPAPDQAPARDQPDGGGEPAAADSTDVQEELDARIAGYLLEGEESERDAAVLEAAAAHAARVDDPLRQLEHCRREFADRIVRLEEGEDPGPVVERFAPAILAALKIGVKIIGRPRVVKFLAGLVAKLISKYVGKQQALALSSALVDAGLRLVSLEAAEGPDPVEAGYALASTVEDTFNRLAQTAPAAAWESEAWLETYTREAFEAAAAAHFPDPLIRPELHEAAQASGAWVALPPGRAAKRYKKYSRIPEATIAPQVARAIKTFGGRTLADFLKDRMGLVIDSPIRARVHLYESIPGTRLGLIALHEKNVSGLGSAGRRGRSLIHPLTPEAAGLLIQEPGLGRAVAPRFLARRGNIRVGQRFYYLEIPGARVRVAPPRPGASPQPSHSTQARVVIDFPKRELRVFLYYSEKDAQDIAMSLRKRLQISALLTALKARLDVNLRQILSGDPGSAVRIIHEAAPTEEFAGPVVSQILRVIGSHLAEVVLKWLTEALKREIETRYDRFVAEFERAVRAEADGVTIILTFQAPALVEQLRRLFRPAGVALPGIITSLMRQVVSEAQVAIRPGFAHE